MVKLRIKTDQVGCRKPGCKRRLMVPHRHHRRCETLFIRRFVGLKSGSKRYSEFVSRYHEFRAEDTVSVCPWHHAEIHVLYDEVIRQDAASRMRPLDRYSWKQAESLMKKLEKFCREWEQEESPGVDPLTVWPNESYASD